MRLVNSNPKKQNHMNYMTGTLIFKKNKMKQKGKL